MLKILYIRAVALLQELIQKINNFGRQRFTIMIIPHSERDIKNIHINNYKLTGVILFFSAIVLLGCFFFITFAIKAKHIDKLAFFRENSVTFLQAYIQETDELDRTIADFKKNFENFTANTALRQFRLPRHEGMGGRDLPIETIDSKLYSGEIQKLQQRQIVNRLEKDNLFIKYTGNVMKNISSFFTEREDFLKNFPSAWPVSAGHYYVFRNFRCNQNRSLTIKTMPGMTVTAAADGTIESITRQKYSYKIVIAHRYGFFTGYENISVLRVNEGDKIKKGTALGRCPGILHYTVKIASTAVDPEKFSVIKY